MHRSVHKNTIVHAYTYEYKMQKRELGGGGGAQKETYAETGMWWLRMIEVQVC